jgi:branched-chain amino acid transport system substrate-binding protein
MKKILPLLVFIFLFTSNVFAVNEIKVGALLSLTGDWSSLGQTSKAAIELAVTDINKFSQSIGSSTKINLRIEDTKLDPQTAYEKLQLLNKAGYKIIIGPQSSAEILGLKKYADENGILIISMGSTASNLSTPDDNIFRMCPEQFQEAKAVVSLIQDDGIKYIIPVYRLDIGNEGLYKSVYDVANEEKLFLTEPVSYTTDAMEFANVLELIKNKITEASSKFPLSQIGIYLAAFDENMELFRQASTVTELSRVKWYGSDGAALSNVLISNSVASDFAIKADYPCPIFGLDNNASEKWLPVKRAVQDITGIEPDAFALSAYDAMWLIVISQTMNNFSKDINKIKSSLIQSASNYYGLTGWTHFNAAGDRQFGNFDYWIVKKNDDGTYSWVKVDSYNGMSGDIIGN